MIVPDVPDEVNGYHMCCYRKFTALSKIQRQKMEANIHEDDSEFESTINENLNENQPLRRTRSDVNSLKPAASTGVFQVFAFFAINLHKKLEEWIKK